MIPLTKAFGEVDALAARTPPGMAFWAGTGPKGRTCRECLHYSVEGRYGTPGGDHARGELTLGRCAKYSRTKRLDGPKFRHSTPVCKYFEENPLPPAIIEHKP